MATYADLSPHERMHIYALSRDGLSQAEIGRRLGRSKATISRELRRNAAGAGYLPDTAQRQSRSAPTLPSASPTGGPSVAPRGDPALDAGLVA